MRYDDGIPEIDPREMTAEKRIARIIARLPEGLFQFDQGMGGRKPFPVEDVTTKRVYESVSVAAWNLRITTTMLYIALSTGKSIYGKRFKYLKGKVSA